MSAFGAILSSAPVTPLKTKDGVLLVETQVLAQSGVPTSPIVFDTRAATIRSMTVKTAGAVRFEVWRSANSDNPVNQAALDAGTETVPNYSNIEWLYSGEETIPEPGMHEFNGRVMKSASQSRYVKLDGVGAAVEKIYVYGGF